MCVTSVEPLCSDLQKLQPLPQAQGQAIPLQQHWMPALICAEAWWGGLRVPAPCRARAWRTAWCMLRPAQPTWHRALCVSTPACPARVSANTGKLRTKVVPWVPSAVRLLLGTGQPLHWAHSSACVVWLHPRERAPTHPRERAPSHPPLLPTGESRKCGRAKTEQKRKSQEFWCDTWQVMLGAVHSQAPHT